MENFNIHSFKDVKWKLSYKDSINYTKLEDKVKKTSNSIVFIDGYYHEKLSSFNRGIGVNIYAMEEYVKINSEFKKTFLQQSK